MNFLKKLLGGGGGGASSNAAASVDYKGYTITPEPQNASGGYRIAATIEKGGQTHHLIRADTTRDLEEAQQSSIRKAKQMIDEQGDGIFR